MSHSVPKKLAVINDFCGFGRCSLAVALPIISAMKIQCCPFPTAIFSNHTGYDRFYRVDFTEHMQAYQAEWEHLNLQFQGILTGFLGSQRQLAIVETFLKRFRTENTVTVIDPVMGDYGQLYPTYSPQLASRLRLLIPYADILTPNLTEACILTGTAYDVNPTESMLMTLCQQLGDMGPGKIVISGIDRGNELENVIYEAGQALISIRIPKVGPCRSGTGDVFASILAADAVNGVGLIDSVRHASDFIAKVLQRTLEWNVPVTDGICFEEFLSEL